MRAMSFGVLLVYICWSAEIAKHGKLIKHDEQKRKAFKLNFSKLNGLYDGKNSCTC